jgi:hypothetical protein
VTAVERIRAIADPAERAREIRVVLRDLADVDQAARQLRAETVQELRAAGMSHAKIGELLGIHRNRAQQVAEGRSGGTRRRSSAGADDADEL